MNSKDISNLSSAAQAKRTSDGKVSVGPKYPCLWVVMVETLIIWMLVGIGVLVWFFSDQFPFTKVSESEPESVVGTTYTQKQLLTDTGIDLKGWLTLTLVPKGREDGGVETYVYDFTDAQDLLYPELNQVPERVAALSFLHTVSSNNAWVTYAGALDVSDEVEPERVLQIFRAPLSDNGQVTPDVFIKSLTEAEQVSQQPGQKDTPQVNSLGDVVYSVLGNASEEGAGYPTAEAYLINHISSTDGQERLLIEGNKPRWVSDTTFVFLRNDGLFSYDVTSRKTHQLLPHQTFGGEVRANIGLSVSDDGSLVAIANPNMNKLSVYRVTDWTDPVPEFVNMAKVTGFWPTFSPDGSILALQSVDAENVNTDPKPKVVFFKIDRTNTNPTGVSEKALKELPFTIDLDQFDQRQMFITDWIK